jgi:hypothetical protein
MNQTNVTWDCGATGLGVLVSDSLMFERGDPAPSDAGLNHIYGLALPFLKRGMPDPAGATGGRGHSRLPR